MVRRQGPAELRRHTTEICRVMAADSPEAPRHGSVLWRHCSSALGHVSNLPAIFLGQLLATLLPGTSPDALPRLANWTDGQMIHAFGSIIAWNKEVGLPRGVPFVSDRYRHASDELGIAWSVVEYLS
ncbi:hypothetical protein B0H11DRAFT_1932899 [Mycena galericulata]|nr:hypothetical protein B0H11DRAFT_1932899 [Mycena galericulata]